MEPPTTTIEQPKNHSTKCQNASKPQKKYFNILIGNNIGLQKERSSTIMPSLESHAGNCPIKSNNIALNLKKKEEKIDKKDVCKKNKYFHKPKSSSVNS